ncbi:hypothetical protein Tdes44962_MAKER03415 [Teratosphaeria destructans]|uniref:Uncharacterized protein n=1 Tax=Teratosphaeria destructans TaxID=418781 RepID=A0A9W7SPZ4_9PEZI|nr:hypothetical protein Tdes44962_MAKER03415 [Teratosphaeria destructans]
MPTAPLTLLLLALATTAAPHRVQPACASTRCLDFIDPCGQMYGGCFPACGPNDPIPAFSDPGCPHRAAATTTSTCDSTACVDKINECGVRYGACYADCEGYATPTLTAPVCATSSSAGAEDVLALPMVTETDFAIVEGGAGATGR